MKVIPTQKDVLFVHAAPSGSRVAYSHALSGDHPNVTAFSVLDLEASGEEVVSRVAYIQFRWSPNGNAMVFVTPEHDLWMLDVDAGKRTRIAQDVLGLAEGSPWTTAGWIAFRRSDGNAWRIRPDGSDQRVLLDADAFLRETQGESAARRATPR